MSKKTSLQRFNERYEVSDTGCWVWTGHITPDNYGSFYLNGRTRTAHSASYEIFIGSIPNGKQIDHKCHNTLCVNPDHLRPLTPKENVNNGLTHNAVKTHCKRGHKFDDYNTFRLKNGGRLCIKCRRIYHNKYKINYKRNPFKKIKHKEECKHGHIFDKENTSYGKDGYRICKTCKREEARKRRGYQGGKTWKSYSGKAA